MGTTAHRAALHRARSRAALIPRIAALGLALAIAAIPTAATATAAPLPVAPYIVVLRSGPDGPLPVDGTIARFRERLAVHATFTYRHALTGFAAALDSRQVAALRADRAVDTVVPDLPMELIGGGGPVPAEAGAGASSPPELTSGVDRVNADQAPLARIDGVDGSVADGQRVDADIAILDTGVQPDHPDLAIAGGYDCADGDSGDRSAWGDLNGHGTHVAGIAAAKDDGVGVVGVAPGARIWSVRIFGRDLRGYTSNLVCAIDWVAHPVGDPSRPELPLPDDIEVANMSMRIPGRDDGACGTLSDPRDVVHEAICRAVAAGVTFTAAAGNERNDASVYIPASYDEVITVSALADFDGRPGGLAAATCSSNSSGISDVDDTFADFSTYGSDVDIIAPGVCIRSTYWTARDATGYRVLSGTSMATPAVAGGVALYRAAYPDAAPAQVQAALVGAGSRDWAMGTDPDGAPERLLDVGSAGAPPDFGLVVRPPVTGVQPGHASSFAVELTRGFAFTDDVDLAITGLPDGALASFTPTVLGGPAATDSLLTVDFPDVPSSAVSDLTIRATGRSSLIVHSAVVRVAYDTTPPVVSAPATRFRMNGVPAGSSVPLRVEWSATDASIPVGSELWDRAGTGSWRNIRLPSPAATSARVALPPGESYTFRVRATDAAGNRRTVDGPAMVLLRRAESSSTIRYLGSWTQQTTTAAYGGALRYSTAAGAEATLTFTGRAVAWLAPKGAARGVATVWLDGVLAGSVDLRSDVTVSSRIVFTRHWTVKTTHTLRIRVDGTAGHPRVDLDELFVLA